MKDYVELAIDLAKQSGQIQMEHLGKVKNIEYKSEINLVTEVDKKCEYEIVSQIQSRFPHHDILAEEGSGKRKDSEYKWIIDPLDGTTNYSHAYPLFCTSIALEVKGEIVLGVVYEPNLAELFVAEKGSGATRNGEKILVSQIPTLRKGLISTGFSYNVAKAKDNNLGHFQDFVFSAQGVRRDGVAAVDLCYTAMGRYDGFWELDLFPWDVAAGLLMVQEAGGRVSDFSGNAFNIYMKEILASNSTIHQEMVSILKGV